MPWGRDEGILERAWSSRVTSKLFFFSSFSNTGGDRGELLEGYANLTVESVSVSPWPTNDRSNCSNRTAFCFCSLNGPARAPLRRADLA